MASPEHLAWLAEGSAAWNKRRADAGNSLGWVDLSEADLRGTNLARFNLRRAYLHRTDLSKADLADADLSQADLSWASLGRANFFHANLSHAILRGSDLILANFEGANLRGADLWDAYAEGASFIEADFTEANLSRTNLTKVNLRRATLVETNLQHTVLVDTDLHGATLIGCRVYGIAAWNLLLDEATQLDLVITPEMESAITVDNLEVAQFVYLLLSNAKLRQIIDTLTTKMVLILGRFTPERKAVLDALRDALRQRGYVPLLFDFTRPSSRSSTETVSTLAHLARFVIADLTDPRSVPDELRGIVPHLASVPVQPLIAGDEREYGLFEHHRRYPWVLEPYRYHSGAELLANLVKNVIQPAEAKVEECHSALHK